MITSKIYQLELQYLEVIDEKANAIRMQQYEKATHLREKEKQIENSIKGERDKLLKIYSETEVMNDTLFDLKIIANYFDPLQINNFLINRINIEIEKVEKLKNEFVSGYKFQESNQQRDKIEWLNKLLNDYTK